MEQEKVTVVAKVKARADRIEQVKQELLALVEPTRQEPGCIDYVLHQSADDPSVFLFYENWRSQADLDTHLQKPHLKQFLDKAGALLAEPLDVTTWRILA